ncbi:DMT family transporter [Candidatus Saccharibacteria bacterium]|nr:DMT family transporter [Candidatus Saccharibacteria bacterium]
MENSLAVAVLAGLGAMLGWGFADFFAKKTIDRIGDLPSLVWAHIFGTSLFFGLALFNYAITGHFVHIPDTLNVWLGLVFFGVLQMIVYWLVYKGFGKGQLAVLNPIFSSYSGLVALISIIFFSEVLTGSILAGLIAIFAGILLMNLDIQGLKSKRLKIAPGLKEVAAAAILAAIWTIFWDKFVHGHDFLAYAMLMYFFMTVAALIAAKKQRTKLLPIKSDLWKFLFLIGLGETIAYLSISLGFSKTTYTSVVAVISGSFALPTVILAHFFLKERITRLQTLGIAAILVGIILIALFS